MHDNNKWAERASMIVLMGAVDFDEDRFRLRLLELQRLAADVPGLFKQALAKMADDVDQQLNSSDRLLGIAMKLPLSAELDQNDREAIAACIGLHMNPLYEQQNIIEEFRKLK